MMEERGVGKRWGWFGVRVRILVTGEDGGREKEYI